MVKRFAIIMTVLVALFVAANQNNVAQAYDHYVGTSNATGWKCYVKTETIYWEHPYICDVVLKMITRNGNVKNLSYRFIMMKHWTEFTNSQGYSGTVNEDYPIELAMWNFIMDYSYQHNIRYK